MAITNESTFFANRGTVTISGVGGSNPSSAQLFVVKDVEVTTSAEHVPLWGFGTIKRQAVARHSGKVGVRVGYAKFKPKSSEFLFYINDPDSGTGGLTDTNSVKLFDVIVTFTNELNETMTATIHDVYFPNFPLKAPEGQWIRMDLDGEGADIVFS